MSMYAQLKFAILACHKKCVAQIKWLELMNCIEDKWLIGEIQEHEFDDLKDMWNVAYLDNARAMRLRI